jgi:hypothetical protein
VKLADTPSYLGGEEQWDKLRLFGAATNHFVEVQVLPLQLIKKGDFLREVAFFAFSDLWCEPNVGLPPAADEIDLHLGLGSYRTD